MQSIKITRPVVIKVRVTEEYKKVVAFELQKLIHGLDLELQQLEFQAKKLQAEVAKNSQFAVTAKQKLEEEVRQRLNKKQQYMDKIKDISRLELGSEVIHGRVESLVELKVGDDWNQLMNVEVLIENGKVLEIRQGV
ncbi:YlqD family protein [Peptococcaceae bacterium 1198_IL3148]